ncbi:MAG: hypothetical protein IT258_02980 [Saprospiraceae bacterium]|nr:hypothetical protein [Saprospiraceae bacterium]
MELDFFKKLIELCGVGHIVLSFASLLIPRFLNWKNDLAALPILLRQMFWTYAAYILVINFCFGIVSIWGADDLLNGSFLAKCLSLFIGFYWFARVLIQFFYFDRKTAPKGLIYTLGEIGLVGLFIIFTLVYFTAFFKNIAWI